MRALIIGAGIGGLSAAVALQRVGIETIVFEKAPKITDVGAGLLLWSNAMLAARRIGVEAKVVAAGSVIDKTRSSLPSGELLDEYDLSAIAREVDAPTVCAHRAELQRILLEAALAPDAGAVQTGRACVGCDEEDGVVTATFADGSRERGDVLIGADGIHSVVRRSLFGDETSPRYAGYCALRGIAHGVSGKLSDGQALLVIGQGAQAGCFHSGGDRIYWFLTRNGPPQSHTGLAGIRAELGAFVADWRVPIWQFAEATDENAILRNDVIHRPHRHVWGRGRVTLLGDAVHAMTPNLGQGACQALEDSVFLAHSLQGSASAEAGLRDYESRRRERAKFVAEQSQQLGRLLQISNPVGSWLRNVLSRTSWVQRQNQRLLKRLLMVDLPELARTEMQSLPTVCTRPHPESPLE